MSDQPVFRRDLFRSLLDHADVLIANGHLDSTEGFEQGLISHVIELNTRGAAVGWNMRYRTDRKGNEILGQSVPLPITMRTSDVKPGLGHDTPDYVLLDPMKRDTFAKRLSDIQEHAAKDGVVCMLLGAMVSFYKNNFELFTKRFLKEIVESFGPKVNGKYPNIRLTFALDDGRMFVEFDEIKPYLIQYDYDYAPGEEPTGRCIVTGIEGPLMVWHPLVKKVRNSPVTGARIISYNNNNSHSYGLPQEHLPPPFSRKVSNAYRALNYLLRSSGNVVASDDRTLVYYTDSSDISAADLFRDVLYPSSVPDDTDDFDADDVNRRLTHTLSSPFHRRALVPIDCRVSVVGLSPVVGRLAITFFEDSVAQDVLYRAEKFRAETRVILPWKPNEPETISITQILDALQGGIFGADRKMIVRPVNPYDDGTIEFLRQDLFLAAVSENYPLPQDLLQYLLHAWMNTMPAVRSQCDRRSGGYFIYQRYQATLAAISNLIHSRSRKDRPMQANDTTMTTGERIGRIFSVMVYTQEKAYPKATTLVEARMKGVMTSPAPNLADLIESKFYPHLREIRDYHGMRGLAIKLRKEFDRLFSDMPPNDLPRTLSPYEKIEFQRGYSCENIWLRTKKEVVDSTSPNGEDSDEMVSDETNNAAEAA